MFCEKDLWVRYVGREKEWCCVREKERENEHEREKFMKERKKVLERET